MRPGCLILRDISSNIQPGAIEATRMQSGHALCITTDAAGMRGSAGTCSLWRSSICSRAKELVDLYLAPTSTGTARSDQSNAILSCFTIAPTSLYTITYYTQYMYAVCIAGLSLLYQECNDCHDHGYGSKKGNPYSSSHPAAFPCESHNARLVTSSSCRSRVPTASKTTHNQPT